VNIWLNIFLIYAVLGLIYFGLVLYYEYKEYCDLQRRLKEEKERKSP